MTDTTRVTLDLTPGQIGMLRMAVSNGHNKAADLEREIERDYAYAAYRKDSAVMASEADMLALAREATAEWQRFRATVTEALPPRS